MKSIRIYYGPYYNFKTALTYKGQDEPELCLNVQFILNCKHSSEVIRTRELMRYTAVIALCSESHTKLINSACFQKLKSMNSKPDGKSTSTLPSCIMYILTVGKWACKVK